MNKKLTTAGAALSPANYISPAVKVTEIHSEGVLCMSMRLLEEWKPADSFEWDE